MDTVSITVDTRFINGPATHGAPNSEDTRTASGQTKGSFESLLLQVGCLQSAPSAASLDAPPSDTPPDAIRSEPKNALVVAVAIIPNQEGGQRPVPVQSDGTKPPVALLDGAPFSSLAEEVSPNPSQSSAAEDTPGAEESDEGSPTSGLTVLESVLLQINFGAVVTVGLVHQPSHTQGQEDATIPPAGGLSPAQPAVQDVPSSIAGHDQLASTASTLNGAGSRTTDEPILAWPVDQLPVVPSPKEALPRPLPELPKAVEASTALPEEASIEVGDLSTLETALYADSAAMTADERGGQYADSQGRHQPSAPQEPQTDNAFQVLTSPPSASRGERSLSQSAGPLEVPTVHTPQPQAPSGPPSVYFEVQPPDAGRVRVHLALSDQTLYARVVTERADVQDFLLRNVGRLETQLQPYGLDVGRFHVDVDRQDPGNSQNAWAFAGERPQPAPHMSVAEEPVKEVTVIEPSWMPARLNLFA
ncbi:MAG: flagellar hook-length control protein FliK [Nitrospiraceae bacterium]